MRASLDGQFGRPRLAALKVLVAGAAVALLVMALPGATFATAPNAGTCSGGEIGSGTWSSFRVTGDCTFADGATVRISGNLTVAAGAILNDHAASTATVNVGGDVLVGPGAIFGLGTYATPGAVGPDTVGGSIVADGPLTLYVGGVTVGGNVISVGGGLPSTSAADFRNFPFKDNVVQGNLLIEGWHGGWLGVVRNHIGHNAIIVGNVSGSNPAGPGVDDDSTEVMGSVLGTQTIGGNLTCLGNTPNAQVNPVDGGLPSIVGGRAIGECRTLVQ